MEKKESYDSPSLLLVFDPITLQILHEEETDLSQLKSIIRDNERASNQENKLSYLVYNSLLQQIQVKTNIENDVILSYP